MRRRLPASVLFVLVSASAVTAFSLVSVEQEIAIGREAQADVRRRHAGSARRAVVALCRLHRPSAGRTSRRSRYPYSFSVADKAELNAFALPGGPVWVHRGILSGAETEAQLAGVMAHEIAHVAERHAAEQLTKATMANGLLGLLGAVLDGRGKGEAAARIGAGLGTQIDVPEVQPRSRARGRPRRRGDRAPRRLGSAGDGGVLRAARSRSRRARRARWRRSCRRIRIRRAAPPSCAASSSPAAAARARSSRR